VAEFMVYACMTLGLVYTAAGPMMTGPD